MNKSAKFLLVLVGLMLVVGLKLVMGGTAAESCVYESSVYEGLELPRLTQVLKTTGLIGRIHGAAPESRLFVLSVREPKNFFSRQEFSIIPGNREARETLSQVHRHDLVCLQGKFLENSSPQKHVAVRSVKVLEAWSGEDDYPAYERQADLSAELGNQTSFVGKVHAVDAEGKILVVEYKDGVLPIYVETPALTQDLFRGDIVRLRYRIQKQPSQPTHLQLDPQAEQPLEVLSSIVAWHQQNKTLAGKLVKFPRSPQIKFDVYAIAVNTLGVERTFTLVNFDDQAVFKEIRTKLGEIWDSHAETIVSGRNLLINPEVTVQATGQINMISPKQANPQILLESVDAIEVQ